VVPAGSAARFGGGAHVGHRQNDWDVHFVGVQDPRWEAGAASAVVERALVSSHVTGRVRILRRGGLIGRWRGKGIGVIDVVVPIPIPR
jgi:hypothetical protein